MTATDLQPASTPLVRSKAVKQPTRFQPVKAWAAIGAFSLALEAGVLLHWIFLSGNFKRTPSGPTPIPEWMTIAAVAHTALGALAFMASIYCFIIRPYRRNRRLSSDGLFALCFILIFWQDPVLNYSVNWATYNTVFPNWGAWTTSIPGWISPRGNLMAEPILWSGPVYLYGIFGACVAVNWWMRRLQSKRPHLSTARMIAICLATFMLIDLVVEVLWLRLGLYAFPGAIARVSLFAGHYYQFPLYEMIFAGSCWAGFACLRYFKNDKGETLAERGVDELRASPRQVTWLRFLAINGAVNVIFLVCFNIPQQWAGLHSDPWPKDIIKRSYLTDGLCGPGTPYACPGADVPIPRRDSAHLNPNGELVPAGGSNDDPVFTSPIP